MENWKLHIVSEIKWQQDNSRLMVYVNWTVDDNIRVNVMTIDGCEPVISFQGTADDVRKALMQWLCDNANELEADGLCRGWLSLEHAAYIGAEIAKAELLKTNYV